MPNWWDSPIVDWGESEEGGWKSLLARLVGQRGKYVPSPGDIMGSRESQFMAMLPPIALPAKATGLAIPQFAASLRKMAPAVGSAAQTVAQAVPQAAQTAAARTPTWLARNWKKLGIVGGAGLALTQPWNWFGGSNQPPPGAKPPPGQQLPPPDVNPPPFGDDEEEPPPRVVRVGNRDFLLTDDGWVALPVERQETTKSTLSDDLELLRQKYLYEQRARAWEFEQERSYQSWLVQLQDQMEQKQLQAGRESQLQLQREQQAWQSQFAQQQAEQAMKQMYAADPWKYWKQLGQPTPEAVKTLTGGQELAAGMQLGRPSAQWWNNLLSSEQRQIMGASNWLGQSPEDWYDRYQQMVPAQQPRRAVSWAR